MNLNLKNIIINNLIFLLLEFIFLLLIFSGIFDKIMSKDTGTSFSFDSDFFFISQGIIILIGMIIAYKRLDNKRLVFLDLWLYYSLSLILLAFTVSSLLSLLPKFNFISVLFFIIIFFVLISSIAVFITKKLK